MGFTPHIPTSHPYGALQPPQAKGCQMGPLLQQGTNSPAGGTVRPPSLQVLLPFVPLHSCFMPASAHVCQLCSSRWAELPLLKGGEKSEQEQQCLIRNQGALLCLHFPLSRDMALSRAFTHPQHLLPPLPTQEAQQQKSFV